MSDKLTDSEIVKALRSWLEEIRKSRQAYLEKVNVEHYPSMRYEYLLSDTIHKINRLQAENEELKDTVKVLRVGVEQAHLIRKDGKSPFNLLKTEIKAEAYKECIEKVKKECPMTRKDKVYLVQQSFLDNILLGLESECIK